MEENKVEQDIITSEIEELNQIRLEGNERIVRKARNALFWTAGLLFLGEMLSMFRGDGEFSIFVFVYAICVAGIFVGLALYTKKKPYTATVLGLIAFVGYLVFVAALYAYVEGATGIAKALFSGIIFKVIIIVTLVNALKDAKELQEVRSEN